MTATRINLALALLFAGLLGIYWAVDAQERPLYTPPQVLPRDEGSTPVPPPAPIPIPKGFPAIPAKGKKKADSLPPEVFDVPRPIVGKKDEAEEKPEIVRVGGVDVPPLPAVEKKEASAPPPLPAMEPLPEVEKPQAIPMPKPLDPTLLPAPPAPDPTKVLIKEPPAKGLPKPPVEDDPPLLVIPPKQDLPAPMNTTQPNKIKSFVRKRGPETSGPPVTPPVMPPPVQQPQLEIKPPLDIKPPIVPPGNNTLATVQTPAITVEKRGRESLKAKETGAYQIIVRNLGPAAAQDVLIEDEIPSGAKIIAADPMPQLQGNKAIWVIPALAVNQEQTLRLTFEASVTTSMAGQTQVQVRAANAMRQTSAYIPRPAPVAEALSLKLNGPVQVPVGKPAVFDVRVVNQSGQPINGITLFGLLPEGLNTPEGRTIEGALDAVFPAGETKTLKMPTTAVKAGRYTVQVKVATKTGVEVSETVNIEVVAEGLVVQQAPTTRLFPARDGDVRIDIVNHTSRTLRNVQVADRLPEGLDFVAATDRGLYQANSRTVHWLIDQLPAGKSKTVYLRVHGSKSGQHSNVVFAKADGAGDQQSTGIILLEGSSDLTMRVTERDNPLELGRETVYEVQVQNPGSAPAQNVQLQVQLPPGLTPKGADASVRHSIEGQTIRFEPTSLGAQAQTIYRITAVARTAGDQRVRFAVVSDQVRTPIEREISTMVYRD